MKEIIKKIVPYKFYEFIWRIAHGHFSYYLWLFPIRKNKITFVNYYGKGFGDNGKYIAQELIKSGDELCLVWLVDPRFNIDKSSFPTEVKLVEYNSWRGLYELATSKIWIDNCRKNFYPPKRSKQIYIHTGHGGVPFKKVEKDAEEKLDEFYINMAKRDSKMADLMLSNSAFKTKILRESYWYEGEILESGIPKVEQVMFKNPGTVKKIRRKFNIPEGTHICLFAPTFRKDNNSLHFSINFDNLRNSLLNKTHEEWVILLRLHPNLTNKVDISDFLGTSVIDVSHYEDMQELLISSNLLITDYSGIMFEFMLTKSPVLLYIYDYEEYSEERGSYFKLEDLPFPKATTEDELLQIIKFFDKNKYVESVDSFSRKIGLSESKGASKRVSEYIRLNIMED